MATKAPTPKEQHRLGLEERTHGEVQCAARYLGNCSGKLTADHVIEVRWLRQAWLQARVAHRIRGRASRLTDVTLDELIADPHNAVFLCLSHNCEKGIAHVRLPASEIPDSVYKFAEHYGLESYLDRVILHEGGAS